jgi:general secretion pathway protein G
MEKKYFNGFTLTELMVVIAVIALLGALIVGFLTSQIFKGNDAKRKGDIDRIKIAAEEYEKDNNCYPKYIVCGVHSDQPIYPYLKDVPCDPITHVSYFYENDGAANCPGWFRIYTVLENTKDLSAIYGIGPQAAFNYVASSSNAPGVSVTTPAPSSSSGPMPTPGGGGQDNFYGCVGGSCVPILWDPARPGPECDPNYQNSSCYGVERCALPANECIPWQ